jgi:osmotically-inducible protein OsmY
MRTDAEIKNDVKAEINWDSRLTGSNIDVEVTMGHATLIGTVNSYMKMVDAERAARRVPGVNSVSNDLNVKIPESFQRSDKDIERAVRDTITWNSSINEKDLKISVKDGWLTLEGTTDWEFQRSKARSLAQDILGVKGITNLIKVKSSFPMPSDVKDRIKQALKRNHYLNGNDINVNIDKGKAILRGQVRTLAEKSAVETAAWSAPGITEVQNDLTVDYKEVFA